MRIFRFAQCSISSGVNEMTRTDARDINPAEEQVDALQAALSHPEAAQAVTLFNIIRNAARCGFGAKHGFARIASVADFQATVPAGGLHTHRSMIELQKASGAEILTMDDVIAYVPAASCGSRRQECLVTVRDMFDRQQLMADALQTMISDGIRNVIDLSVTGTSAYGVALGGAEPQITGFQWLASVDDPETRAYLLCLIVCSTEDVDGLVANDIAAYQRMADVLARHGASILTDLEGRTVRVHDRVDTAIARRVRDLINPAPEMLAHLRSRLDAGHRLLLADVFPNVRVAGTDVSTGDVVHLSEQLHQDVKVVDLGCSLPEGLLSFALGEGEGTVPSLLNVFFEFNAPDSDETLGLHQIGEGKDYSVSVTTASGLYRCRLGVTARVVGWEGACPRIAFVRQSLVGSDDTSVIDAGLALATVQRTITDLGAPRPFVRISRRCDGGFRVTLSRCSVEALGAEAAQAAIDANLCRASLHYDRVRELGRFGPVDVVASPVVNSARPNAEPSRGCNAA